MKHTYSSTRAIMTLLLGLLLLSGYRPVQAQDGPAHGAQKTTDHRGMMENCPMMQDPGMRAKMMEACPMMKSGGDMDHASMMEMMKNCPMMREMMKECPMMKGEEHQHQGAHGEGHHGMHGKTGATMPAAEEAVDGVQEVSVSVDETGFAPKQFELKAGVPARITFLRTSDSGCSHHVQSQDLDIEKTPLPVGEPVTFEFTPEKDGTFTFACAMGMMRGTIVVRS